jgi:DnaJ-domain-containing protein 1
MMTRRLFAPNGSTVMSLHVEEGGNVRSVDPSLNHFAVYGLPPRLCLDLEAIRAIHLELSRKVHPDFHATADEMQRRESLQRSALLNNAWKVLRDLPRRAEYLVERFGLGISSDKGAVPPELLEEMFDIQEAGEELREARLSADGEALKAAEARVGPLRVAVMEARGRNIGELESLAEAFDNACEQAQGNLGADEPQAILRKIRLTLDRLNYLRTVLRNLK